MFFEIPAGFKTTPIFFRFVDVFSTISSTISHLSWLIITGKLAIGPDSEFNVGEVFDKILCKTLVFKNALITL